MPLYRSESAHARVRSWCEGRLSAALPGADRLAVQTCLGPTHVTRWGSGPGELVVLPGTNFNAATSASWAGELTGSGRVSVVDLPGQPGLSSPGRLTEDKVQSYRRWGRDLLDGLGCGPFVLVAESLGAAVALCLEPRSVAGLVLVSPGGIVPARVGLSEMRASMAWMLRPTEDRSRRLLNVMCGAGHQASPETVEWMTLVARSCRSGLAPAPLPGVVLSGWAHTPAVVVVGSQDCFFSADLIAARLARWTEFLVRTVEGAGHLLAHEEPDAVAGAVREVVART